MLTYLSENALNLTEKAAESPVVIEQVTSLLEVTHEERALKRSGYGTL